VLLATSLGVTWYSFSIIDSPSYRPARRKPFVASVSGRHERDARA
jgi:hypothetical protein